MRQIHGKKPENGHYSMKEEKLHQKSQQGTSWYLSKNPDVIINRAT